jgi:hypothetical protein
MKFSSPFKKHPVRAPGLQEPQIGPKYAGRVPSAPLFNGLLAHAPKIEKVMGSCHKSRKNDSRSFRGERNRPQRIGNQATAKGAFGC